MKNPSRLNKTEQIIELAMMFQNSYRGLCIDDIAEHFECSRRSAERMKTLLFELFADKVEDVPKTDRKKYWRFKKGTMNFLVSFTTEDFVNLEKLKELSNDENIQKQLDEVIAKIKALTPQKDLNRLETDIEALIESENYAVKQYSKEKIDNKILLKIRESILSFKKLSITYQNENGEYSTIIHPYGILIADKKYLVAYNETKKAIRYYRLSKIKSVEIIDEYFEISAEQGEGFNLKQYCEKSFGVWNGEEFNVKLLFNPNVKDDVMNYYFHPTQKIKANNDGSVNVSFKASGEFAICQELFKWGGEVKIIAPQKLKNYYIELLDGIMKVNNAKL